MNSDSSPAMNPQRTWADLCGDTRDCRGRARPPARHLGVSAGTRQPTHTVSPVSIPRVSGPASVGHRVQGARQVRTLHDTGRRFLHPIRPHSPHRVGTAQPHCWPVAGEAMTHTGLVVPPLTRRKEGQGDLRELGEAGRQLAALNPTSGGSPLSCPCEPSRAAGTGGSTLCAGQRAALLTARPVDPVAADRSLLGTLTSD